MNASPSPSRDPRDIARERAEIDAFITRAERDPRARVTIGTTKAHRLNSPRPFGECLRLPSSLEPRA